MANTQHHEILAWLGPAADELTPEQVDRLAREADDIAAYYPDPDDADQREAALTAACRYLLGELTLEQAGQERRATQVAEARARTAAIQVAAMVARDGADKAPTARAAGIDRMTLLRRLGERD
jgi:copper oxidase (laccase) domain-containing protein